MLANDTSEVLQDRISTAPWMLQRNGCCVGSASLTGVKRIRISIGYADGSRDDTNISGLWIEYWHTKNDTIIGQWLKEAGSLDVAKGERLVEISTWLRRDGRRLVPQRRFEKIAGMSFTVTSRQKVSFISGTADRAMVMTYRATRFERMVPTTLH